MEYETGENAFDEFKIPDKAFEDLDEDELLNYERSNKWKQLWSIKWEVKPIDFFNKVKAYEQFIKHLLRIQFRKEIYDDFCKDYGKFNKRTGKWQPRSWNWKYKNKRG